MESTSSTAAPEGGEGAPADAPADASQRGSGWWSQFCPDHVVASVCEITPARLASWGIRALILDLDNTLVLWHGEEVACDVAEWVRQLREAGFRLCIASNTHRPARLRRLAERLGVQYASGVAKPRRGGFYRSMELMGAGVEETAVVGDQLLTDIWGGNRCGLLTVLVTPLSPREFLGTRWISRPIERWLLARLHSRGRLRPGEEPGNRHDASNAGSSDAGGRRPPTHPPQSP